MQIQLDDHRVVGNEVVARILHCSRNTESGTCPTRGPGQVAFAGFLFRRSVPFRRPESPQYAVKEGGGKPHKQKGEKGVNNSGSLLVSLVTVLRTL